MKFHVGDKVRIKKDLKVGWYYGHAIFTAQMQRYAGNIITIGHVSPYANFYIANENNWSWTDDMLEPVSAREEIHITRDGDTVHAVYNLDDKIVKRAKTMCDPEDEFEFRIGAVIALGKAVGFNVMAKPKPTSKLDPIRFNFDDFKSGKFAVNCTTECDAEVFLAYLHGKGVNWCSGKSTLKYILWSRGSDTCYKYYVQDPMDGIGVACKNWYEDEENIPVIPFCKDEL